MSERVFKLDHTALIRFDANADSRARRGTKKVKYVASAIYIASWREAQGMFGVRLGRRGNRGEKVMEAVENMQSFRENNEEMRRLLKCKPSLGMIRLWEWKHMRHKASKDDIRKINSKHHMHLKALSSIHRKWILPLRVERCRLRRTYKCRGRCMIQRYCEEM